MARRGKGEGSIRRRKDGRWEGSVTVGTTKNGNPKRRFVYGKTKREVAQKQAELRVQLGKGTLVEPDRVTVAEWLERCLKGKTNVSEETRQKYTYEVQPVIDAIGGVRLQALQPVQIRDCYTTLASQGVSVRGQKKAATHLRGALREAVHLEVLTRNPAAGIKLSVPRVEKVSKVWRTDEVKRFLKVSNPDPLYPLFYLKLT